MNLSPEFFKALWLETANRAFIDGQEGHGSIFCEHAENPLRARGMFLKGTLSGLGPDYYRCMPIDEEAGT